ncbi:hypothetical protein M0802_001520 [Mischocyttarus mexicanus]|nr:hypothetical protein M0802_001520 [Mischocyttarus mexicanus]
MKRTQNRKKLKKEKKGTDVKPIETILVTRKISKIQHKIKQQLRRRRTRRETRHNNNDDNDDDERRLTVLRNPRLLEMEKSKSSLSGILWFQASKIDALLHSLVSTNEDLNKMEIMRSNYTASAQQQMGARIDSQDYGPFPDYARSGTSQFQWLLPANGNINAKWTLSWLTRKCANSGDPVRIVIFKLARAKEEDEDEDETEKEHVEEEEEEELIKIHAVVGLS